MATLCQAIQNADEVLENPTSILSRAGSTKVEELGRKLTDCRVDLETLERLLDNYKKLDPRSKSKSLITAIRYARQDISAVLTRLTSRTRDIDQFLTVSGAGSLGRIEKRLDEIFQEIQVGSRDPTTLPSPVRRDQANLRWNTLREEFLREGITVEDLEARKEQICTYLRRQTSPGRSNKPEESGTPPAVPIPAGPHWRRGSTSHEPCVGQFVGGPGTDALIVCSSIGSNAARPPSPMPFRTDGESPCLRPMLSSQECAQAQDPGAEDVSRDLHLCPYSGCRFSLPGKGFQHPLDRKSHVNGVHLYTGALKLDQTERITYRHGNPMTREPRTYAKNFASEDSAPDALSKSCPSPKHDSRSVTQSPRTPNVPWGMLPPRSPMGRSSGSVYSQCSSPKPSFGSSLPTPPMKRRPSGSTEEYEVTEYYRSGIPRRTSIHRRMTSSTSSFASEPVLDYEVRHLPSAPDLKHLHSGDNTVSRGEQCIDKLPPSRSQVRRTRQRGKETAQKSKINSLRNTLQQAKEERDLYLRGRDFYKRPCFGACPGLFASSHCSIHGRRDREHPILGITRYPVRFDVRLSRARPAPSLQHPYVRYRPRLQDRVVMNSTSTARLVAIIRYTALQLLSAAGFLA